MRKIFHGSVVALTLCAAHSASSAPLVINDSLRAWHDAASTSRADILLLGDSVALSGGHGWDAGVHQAAAARYGLAGTGLVAGRAAGEGQGWYYAGSTATAWSTDPALAHGNPTHDAPLGLLTSTSPAAIALGLTTPGLLDPAAGYTLDVWAAGDPTPPATGAFVADRRLGQAPWSVRQTFLSPNLTDTTHRYSFSFDPTADPRTELRIRNTTDATIYGLRATTANNRGVSVTTVGRNGFSALDFYQNIYAPLSTPARHALLNRLVDRGSGKLAVFVFLGINDTEETEPSLTQNITDADSPQAYIDNMLTLINAISNDWTTAGHNPADLSFLTAGNYPVADNALNTELRDYAAALETLATTDPRISFVDLPAYTPDFATLNAQGTYVDGLHPSQTGAAYFGERLFVALDQALRLADYDGNGQVEQGDLDLVLQNWGLDTHATAAPVGWVTRKPNGLIDQAELDAVLQHWGSNAAPDFQGSPVPEPAFLLPLLALALAARRSRQA